MGRGVTPPIDADVARWMNHEDLKILRQSSSTVIQSLLLTEGRVDLDRLHRAAGDWYPETVELIEVLRASSDGSGLDVDALATIADSETPYAWGPMWARLLIGNSPQDLFDGIRKGVRHAMPP